MSLNVEGSRLLRLGGRLRLFAALAIALAASLILPAGAWAGGTWTSSDLTNLNVSWASDNGPVYYTVFTLAQQVQSATMGGGAT